MNQIKNLKYSYLVVLVLVMAAWLNACAMHQQRTVYEQVGGQAGVEKISDAFIDEIQYDKQILAFFLDTNIDRFREKFIEHMCVHLGGPCTYTGDNMLQVHQGMNITEADFNRVVELLINAMTKAAIPHRVQNQLLAKLAPMRADMIYH
tara:strand:+ start:49064 stop:49510 length:447 start_codon:yes stop_codon:yes gene_type:complete